MADTRPSERSEQGIEYVYLIFSPPPSLQALTLTVLATNGYITTSLRRNIRQKCRIWLINSILCLQNQGITPILDENYYQMLNSLPPDLKKAWVDGEWNLFKGLAFKSFKKETHVIEPFYIPEHWSRQTNSKMGLRTRYLCL